MAKIVFVDDEPITLEMLGKAAELMGHQAVLIGSSAGALPAIEEHRPDLVMMDMMMPGVDGLTVLQRLRASEATATIPVVILSAGAALDDRERAEAAGAQAYLTKPVSLNVLLDTIQKFSQNK